MKPTKSFRQLLIPNKTIVCLSSPNQPKRVALVTYIGTSSLEYLFLKKGRFARGFAPFSCTCIEILPADQGRSGLWLHYYLRKIFSATVTNEEILDDCLLPRFKRLFTAKQLVRLYLQAKDKRVRELALFAISKTSKKGQRALRRLCRTLPVIDLIDLTYIYESCMNDSGFCKSIILDEEATREARVLMANGLSLDELEPLFPQLPPDLRSAIIHDCISYSKSIRSPENQVRIQQLTALQEQLSASQESS